MKKCFVIENKFHIFRKKQKNTEKNTASDGDMTSIKSLTLTGCAPEHTGLN